MKSVSIVLVGFLFAGCANPCNNRANYPTDEGREACNVERMRIIAAAFSNMGGNNRRVQANCITTCNAWGTCYTSCN